MLWPAGKRAQRRSRRPPSWLRRKKSAWGERRGRSCAEKCEKRFAVSKRRESSRKTQRPMTSKKATAVTIPNIGEAFAEIAAECPALDGAFALLTDLHKRLRGTDTSSGVVDYVMACASTAVIGVNVGRYWSKDQGFPLAQTARYALAAGRFATAASVLSRFRISGLEGMADRAQEISDGFRLAATEGPGGKHLS